MRTHREPDIRRDTNDRIQAYVRNKGKLPFKRCRPHDPRRELNLRHGGRLHPRQARRRPVPRPAVSQLQPVAAGRFHARRTRTRWRCADARRPRPTTMFVPTVTVTGRSVESRTVRQGDAQPGRLVLHAAGIGHLHRGPPDRAPRRRSQTSRRHGAGPVCTSICCARPRRARCQRMTGAALTKFGQAADRVQDLHDSGPYPDSRSP